MLDMPGNPLVQFGFWVQAMCLVPGTVDHFQAATLVSDRSAPSGSEMATVVPMDGVESITMRPPLN